MKTSFLTFILLYLVGVVANYSGAREETQSNPVSDFRDFVCSLFPKAILFTFVMQKYKD